MWWIVSYKPLAGVMLGNSWYHLEYHFSFDFAGNRYQLIRCDIQDTNCETLETDIPNRYSPNQLSDLVANPEANTVSIIVNGEIISSYAPQ